MRLGTGSAVTVLTILLACGCGGDAGKPAASGAEKQAVAQALTDGISFTGGVRLMGLIPAATANDVTLVPNQVSLVLMPGDPPTLMSLGFDNPDESTDPVAAVLIQFDGADNHIEVPRKAADAGAADAGAADAGAVDGGVNDNQVELQFTLDDTVCDSLCNKVFELNMLQAVTLKHGGVSKPKTRALMLDCTKKGDAKFCASAKASKPASNASGVTADDALAGACTMTSGTDTSTATQCTGLTEYTSCVRSMCGLDGCLQGDCKDFEACTVSAADPCNNDCTPSATCTTCLGTIGSCAVDLCFDKLACGTRVTGGACDQLEACCATTMDTTVCPQIKLLETAGDEGCMGILSSLCPPSM